MHDFSVATVTAAAKFPSMHAKSEELLFFLLWTCDMLAKPTFRNVTDSFEAWAYRNGFDRQLALLERRSLIEASPPSSVGSTPERIIRLTQAGRTHALGGRDPVACWSRPWDGCWRWAIYDLPAAEGTQRNRLRNCLRSHGFGWLQNSVWVSPHPLPDEFRLAGIPIDVESLLFIEARTCAGEADKQIVAGAWDFGRICQLYSQYISVLDEFPAQWLPTEAGAERLRLWLSKEREAWLNAISADPLLPAALLPAGYTGQKAWNQRLEVFAAAAEQMRSFQL
jgi:DNA-binding transcriptional regulator PaaX